LFSFDFLVQQQRLSLHAFENSRDLDNVLAVFSNICQYWPVWGHICFQFSALPVVLSEFNPCTYCSHWPSNPSIIEYSCKQGGMRQYVSQFETIIKLPLLCFEIHDNTNRFKPVPNDTGIVNDVKDLKTIFRSVEKRWNSVDFQYCALMRHTYE